LDKRLEEVEAAADGAAEDAAAHSGVWFYWCEQQNLNRDFPSEPALL
jgi:hypothetical protein